MASLDICKRSKEVKEHLQSITALLRGQQETSLEKVSCLIDYGNILYEMQEWEGSSKIFKEALNAESSFINNYHKIGLYQVLGNILQQLGRFSEAKREYRQVWIYIQASEEITSEDWTEDNAMERTLHESFERCRLHNEEIKLFFNSVSARDMSIRFVIPGGRGSPEDFARKVREKSLEIGSIGSEKIVYIEGLPVPWAYAMLLQAIPKSCAVVIYLEDDQYVVVDSHDSNLPIGEI